MLYFATIFVIFIGPIDAIASQFVEPPDWNKRLNQHLDMLDSTIKEYGETSVQTIEELFWVGHFQSISGKETDALRTFNKIVEISRAAIFDPDRLNAILQRVFFRIALVYADIGDSEAAEKWSSEALSLTPWFLDNKYQQEIVEISVFLGEMYLRQGQYLDAKIHFQRLETYLKRHGVYNYTSEIELGMSKAIQGLGHWEKSIPILEKLHASWRGQGMDNLASEICLLLGRAYKHTNQNDSAIFYYLHAHRNIRNYHSISAEPHSWGNKDHIDLYVESALNFVDLVRISGKNPYFITESDGSLSGYDWKYFKRLLDEQLSKIKRKNMQN